jgi:hypothetical protein
MILFLGGRRVKVQRKPLALLAHLLEYRGRSRTSGFMRSVVTSQIVDPADTY